ncbi:MAG: MBL fold metallo-hydrolase [Bacteroidales bacterium]|nr:MBL fold metallo-hydrolase [Bacteroidales bacterium]
MELFRFVVNLLEENTYIAASRDGRCVVVDPGVLEQEEVDALTGFIASRGFKPEAILLTHGHMDHIYGVAALQRQYGIPVYMSDADKPIMKYFVRWAKYGIPSADTNFTTTDVKDGSVIEAAGMKFRAIATPGHTPGGICYLDEESKSLFTGDTLFAGTIGRTDLEGGDYDSLIRSIMEKLAVLDGDVKVYPGHAGESTIGIERVSNPLLEPFNEREEIPELNENK